MFSLSEMASLQETAGVRGFLDDFITCPDTIRQVSDRPHVRPRQKQRHQTCRRVLALLPLLFCSRAMETASPPVSRSRPAKQVLRRNNKIHRAFLGSAATQLVIASDPRFLPSLGKPVKGIPTGCVIYAGGKRGLVEGQAVDSLQQYSAKISLYGNRGASTRVTEVEREEHVLCFVFLFIVVCLILCW